MTDPGARLPAPTPADLAAADRQHARTKAALDALLKKVVGGERSDDPAMACVEIAFGWCVTAAIELGGSRHGPLGPAMALLAESLVRVDSVVKLHQPVLLRKGAGADYYVTVTVCSTCGGSDAVFDDGTLAPGRAATYPCATLRALRVPS